MIAESLRPVRICTRGDDFIGKFGDELILKSETTLRIGFQNIGGFPLRKGKLKEDLIRYGIL